MSEYRKEEPQEDLQSKLTLYVMGEADEATRVEVEAALNEDDGLRSQHEELVRALELLRQPQLQPVLGNQRRDALRVAAAEGPTGSAANGSSNAAGKILVMPKWSVAAALLIFGGMITIWQKPWQMQGPETSQKAMGQLGYSGGQALESMGYTGSSSGLELGYMSDSAPVKRKDSSLRESPMLELAQPVEELNLALDPVFISELGYSSEDEVVDLERARDDLRANLAPKQKLSTGPAAPSTPASPAVPGAAGGGFALTPSDTQAWSRKLTTEKEESVDFRGLGNDPSVAMENDLVFDSFDDVSSGFDSDDSENLNVVARSENLYDDRLKETKSIYQIQDGFGRHYQDRNVLVYLKPQYAQEKPSDMFFRFYGDNPAIYTRHESLSTFAADVDTASYPLTRSYLVNNQLPPKASIRTEEFLNYFDYDMAAPQEDDFAVTLQATQSKFGTNEQMLLSVGIKAKEVAASERKPMNLVFVIDKSGSMAGERMQLVKDALMLLVDQIRDTDTIGLVTFDSNGHIVLEATAGTERFRIREAIRGLDTGGSTNAGEGLALGYHLMEKVFQKDSINRVVLASDGVANTGVTDQESILKFVMERTEAKVDLTTLGVGMGNHNDVFLEQLADKGNGSCHYLDDLEEAKRVLVDGFLGTMITVARDVKIQVEFDAKQVLQWRQLGYENRSLAHQDFRNDAVDAGEVGSGHEVVALYEVTPTSEANLEAEFVTVRLRWKPEGSDQAVEREYSLNLAVGKGRWDLAPVRLREMGVVAQYAEVLRRSWHARQDSYAILSQEAKRLAGELSGEPEVQELSAMIDRTAKLARWAPAQDDLSLLLEEARRQRLLEAELVLASSQNDVQELLMQVRQQNLQLEGQLEKMLQKD